MTGKSQDQPLPLRELFAQLWELLTQQDRMRAGGVLLFLLVGTVLEILGVGMIIPVVALLSQPDVANSSAAMQSLHATLGSPSHQAFIFWALGGLMAAFVIKNMFLFLSIHWQTRFLVNFRSKSAGELATGYFISTACFPSGTRGSRTTTESCWRDFNGASRCAHADVVANQVVRSV